MSRISSTDLFDLVKSLTKSEKRLFKLYASRHTVGKKNKYVVFFDAIDHLEDYNEQVLLERNPTLQHSGLKSMKPYLYDLIFRSLRNSFNNQSPISQIRYQIDQAEFLIAKGLHKQAAQLLKKTKTSAEKQESLPRLLDILHIELSMISVKGSLDQTESYQRVRQEIETVIKQMKKNLEYHDRFMEMDRLITKSFLTHPEKQQHAPLPLKKSFLKSEEEEEEPTFFAKAKLYEMHYRNSYAKQDVTQSLKYGQKIFDLFDAHPVQKSVNQTIYRRIVFNHFRHCLYFGEYPQMHENLTRLQELAQCQNNISIAYWKYANFLCQLRSYDFASALETAPELEHLLTEQSHRLPEKFILTCYLDIAVLYTITQECEQALLYISRIMNSSEIHSFPKLHYCTKLLSLICHYELGNERVLESCIRSTYRFLKKQDFSFGQAKFLVQFLNRLKGIVEKEKFIAMLKDYHEKLLKEHNQQEERIVVNPQFDLVAWLQSKIEERPFAEVLKEKRRST